MVDFLQVDQFLIDQVHPVMDFDATLASHPIVQTVATPDQITEIFDSISYNKVIYFICLLNLN